jgi:hypothetical protein
VKYIIVASLVLVDALPFLANDDDDADAVRTDDVNDLIRAIVLPCHRAVAVNRRRHGSVVDYDQ